MHWLVLQARKRKPFCEENLWERKDLPFLAISYVILWWQKKTHQYSWQYSELCKITRQKAIYSRTIMCKHKHKRNGGSSPLWAIFLPAEGVRGL